MNREKHSQQTHSTQPPQQITRAQRGAPIHQQQRSFHPYHGQRCSEAESPLVRMNRSVQFTVGRRCSSSVRHARPLMSEPVTATCQYGRIPLSRRSNHDAASRLLVGWLQARSKHEICSRKRTMPRSSAQSFGRVSLLRKSHGCQVRRNSRLALGSQRTSAWRFVVGE